MRNTALEFCAKGELAFSDLGEPPEPGPAEILLETRYTGLTNGTERHAFLSEHGYGGGRFPSRNGYQHVARVVATGEEVTRFEIGDPVFFGGYVGHNGWNVVPEDGLLIKLPAHANLKYYALFGVAGVALRAVRRMGVGPANRVWVVGQGPIGHFLGQAARSAGARVTVSDMIGKRLDAARGAGAHRVLDAGDPKTLDAIRDGGPYDYIFDCCSAKTLLADIHTHRLLAHGGTIGMVAVRGQVHYPWSLLHLTEAKIETSCHFENDDLRVLLFLYEQELIKIAPMVSHMVSIDEVPHIYRMLAQKAHDLLGVIFDWS